MISSESNQNIKDIIRLQTKASARRKEKLFIVEGIKMYQEIPEGQLVKTYLSESFYAANREEFTETDSCIIVSDRIFKNISDTVTPQGIMAIVRQHEYSLREIIESDLKKAGRLFVVLENLQDPGNLGTIVRTSEGAGVDAIIMSKATVDIYNPKVIRSTMGSIYRVPFVYVEDIVEAVLMLKNSGIITYAAHLNGQNDYYDEDYRRDSAFLIGNEANGLSEELASKSDCLIKIPMSGQVESLNAAIATTILLYEAKRQKRK